MDAMDIFVEQIVQCRKGTRQWLIVAGVGLLAVLLCGALIFFLLPFIGAVVIVPVGLILFGAYWLITGQSSECEYSITNGDLDIDRIIARRKRVRLVSVHGAKIETAAPYKPEQMAGRAFDRTVLAASAPDAPGVWAFSYRSKKNGHTLVLFEPSERVLKAFLDILPRPLQLDARRQAGL